MKMQKRVKKWQLRKSFNLKANASATYQLSYDALRVFDYVEHFYLPLRFTKSITKTKSPRERTLLFSHAATFQTSPLPAVLWRSQLN